jgi:uncharacterized protein (DUF302 family)
MKINVSYGITRTLAGTSLADAKTRATAALKTEGFGVLTEIDLQATLKAKLGVDVDPYVILGACNPPAAHRAVSAEPGVGLLLPCNVVLTQDGPNTVVSAVSPRALFHIVEKNPAVAEIAEDIQGRLERAIAAM